MSEFWMGVLVGAIVGTNCGICLVALLLWTKHRKDYPLPPAPKPFPLPKPGQEEAWLIAAEALGFDAEGRVNRERAS